jgi:radial spoke head protein 4A
METANVQTELYELLSKIKSKENNKNIYDHLLNLYETQLEMNDDKKFLDLFEDISYKLKLTDGRYLDEESEKNLKSLFTYLEEFCKSSKSRKTLIEPLTKKDGDEVTPVTQVGYVPEYYNLFQIFEWLGISLGDKESYLLTNSLRNLANQKNLPNVIFWGKIYGTDKDYFIAEATGGEGGGNLVI